LLAAIGVLGIISVVQLEQALESSGFRKLASAVISLVPVLGTLLVAWTYFRAAGVLKEAGLTSGNGLLSAGDVRSLGGLDEKAMLPSLKIALTLLLGAAIVGAMLMPKGH